MILSVNTRLPLNHHHFPSSKAYLASNDNDDEEAILDASSFDTLLRDLQPVIHYIAQFIRLAQWKDNETKYSLLLLSSWILWWKLHQFILYLLPIVLVSAKIYHDIFMSPAQQHTRHQHTSLNKQALLEDLTELHEAIYLMSTIKNWIQKSDTLCRAYYRYYSIATTKRRSIICFSVACLFIMVYAGWIFLLHQQMITSAASISWFFILVIICLHSPWVNPIYTACVRAVMPLIHHFLATTITTSSSINRLYTQKKQDNNHGESINGYCFQIYHHQRWWFPTGWSNLLLPQDRPVWSDIHLESTPSIDEFRLPPTIFIGKPNDQNQRRIVSWTWIDPCWSKQQDCSDKDGRQYGSWKWKSWSFQSSGLGICTRRQKWTRYAQRKESWVDIKPVSSPFNDEKEEEDCCDNSCSSIIGGSNTTASSTSSIYSNNWDNVSSLSCSTTSTAETLPFTPILISNMNERLRRCSSHSVTFNTPILSCSQQTSSAALVEDDMYKQFCVSPRPQKLKRHSII